MLTPGVNSYVTSAEAAAYVSTTFHDDAWNDLDGDVQERLLITATRRLNGLRFAGLPLAIDQLLPFPRYAPRPSLYPNGVLPVVPQVVKDAQVEEALALMDWRARRAALSGVEGRLSNLQEAGVTAIRRKLGDVETQYTLSGAGAVVDLNSLPVCSEALRLLGPYLLRNVVISSQNEYPKHYLLPDIGLED